MQEIDLAFKGFGEAGKPIVILHGLLGSGRNWASHAKHLGKSHRVVTLDLRNHGSSPWSDEMTYEAMADDVRRFVELRDLGPITLIGHSMGGKAAMRLALDHPALVEKLVVVDIAPVDYDHSTVAYVDAMQAIDVGQQASRQAIDDLLATSVPEAAIRAFLLQNLDRREQGFAWKANLATLSNAMPDLMAFPSRASDLFEKPTIFLAGANSTYVKVAEQPAIKKHFPTAEIRYIADAGHWVHAEQPVAFSAHLQNFLSR